MKQFIYQSLEKALNHYLALDPESSARLLALDNKIILVELFLSETNSYFIKLNIKHGKLQLTENLQRDPDVRIKGTPLSLVHMSLAKENRKQFFAEDVLIEGDLELGQQIIDLFDAMEVDWEELTSGFIGDVPAHQLGRFTRGVKQFINRVSESLLQNVNEYVHEEKPLFPPREALNDFFQDIDILRMDADRLEAKLHLLSNKLQRFKRVL